MSGIHVKLGQTRNFWTKVFHYESEAKTRDIVVVAWPRGVEFFEAMLLGIWI